MAHWLKAAEDLFEVVDRRAKLVVGDELPNSSQSPAPLASNGQGSRAKNKRSKAKTKKEKPSNEASVSKVSSDKDLQTASTDNDKINHVQSSSKTEDNDEQKSNNDVPKSDAPMSMSSSDDHPQHDTIDNKDTETSTNGEIVPPIINGDIINETSSKSVGIMSDSVTIEESEDKLLENKGTEIEINKERPQSLNSDTDTNTNTNTPSKIIPQKDSNIKIEPQIDEKKNQEHKNVSTPTKVQDQFDSPNKKTQDDVGSLKKVQDQLEEAQGLLESSKTTGQSKEARLARVCAGLSSRLQEYKSENAQLEELLVAERDLSKSYEARIQQLQKDLSLSKEEVNRVESNMLEALAAKNAEIEALVSSMEMVKKQAALSEGNLASLQANMESIMRSRELTETRMMQALKEELASAERRAEEEHAAHNATKMAAMEREVELEHRALDASTALAKIQRMADERTAKAMELEQKVALLEVECSSLTQELQDTEARARRGHKKSPEDANQVIQMQAWQEEVERARQAQREAERKLSSMEAEVQKMRVEMAAMKRDAEHYSRQEHMELEKRYRELTDLLYYKQTQLEAMTSEKAAAEFQLEKEMKRIQEAQVEVEKSSRFPRRASSSWDEDTDVKSLEPLPFHHRHLVGASIQLQKAAKILDTGAVRAMRFLWRYPVARLLLLFYMVFVHLFMMYLLHRLQEQADTLSSREFAESMGLGNHTLLP